MEIARSIFRSPIYAPNGRNELGWAGRKPRAWTSVHASLTGVRDPDLWAYLLSPTCINREPEQKRNS